MINGAILGAEKGHEFVFSIYEEVKKSLRTNFIPIPRIITYIYQKNTNLKDIKIFEKEVFYPFNPYASPIKQLLYKDIQKTLWLYITGVSHGTHRLFKNAIED